MHHSQAYNRFAKTPQAVFQIMAIDFGLLAVGGAVVALVYAVVLIFNVRSQNPGTPKMQEIASAVSSGKLTQSQADAITADLQQRVTDLVNGTLTSPPRGERFRGGPFQSPTTGANA